jgi:hypothetical protein
MLEAQEARAGADTKPDILIEIEDIRNRVADTENQLAGKQALYSIQRELPPQGFGRAFRASRWIWAVTAVLVCTVALVIRYYLGYVNVSIPNNKTKELEEITQIKGWQLVYDEGFTGNDMSWYVNKWQNESITSNVFIEKRYRAEDSAKLVGFWDQLWSEKIDLGNTFYVEAELQKLRGRDDSGFGFLIYYNRAEKPAYYCFQIRNNQTVLIFANDRDNITNLYSSNTDAIIPGEINKLGIVAIDSKYKFFINNKLVTQLDDTRIRKGKVGFWINVSPSESSVVEIDNFRLYAP